MGVWSPAVAVNVARLSIMEDNCAVKEDRLSDEGSPLDSDVVNITDKHLAHNAERSASAGMKGRGGDISLCQSDIVINCEKT
jgi:hypothetical protein